MPTDRQLQEILDSGELTSGKLGGSGIDRNIVVQAGLDAVETKVDQNIQDIVDNGIITLANEGKIDGIIAGTTALDKLSFPTGTTPTLTEGQMGYDGVHKQFIMQDDISGATLNVGHEMWIKVYNASPTDIIYNGMAVRQSGVQSGYPIVTPALADTYDNAQVIGVATHDIAPQSFGNITTQGKVGDFPTAGLNVGDTLFLSDTTPGGVTTVLPAIGSIVGVVLTTDTFVGDVYVKPRSLVTLPPIGGWMKQATGQYNFTDTPLLLDTFTNVSLTAGLSSDMGIPGVGEASKYIIGIDGTYEISVSISLINLSGNADASILGLQIYKVNTDQVLFEYNMALGRQSSISSGTTVTQDDFVVGDEIGVRVYGKSGATLVHNNAEVENVAFLVKSVLIR